MGCVRLGEAYPLHKRLNDAALLRAAASAARSPPGVDA